MTITSSSTKLPKHKIPQLLTVQDNYVWGIPISTIPRTH